MAKKTITNDQALSVMQDIERINNESPAIALLQENRFTKFLQSNVKALANANEGLRNIQLKYIEHNSEVHPIKKEGETDWKYLESVIGNNGQLLTGDMVRQAYIDEVGEFLGRKITVEI